MFSPLKKKIHLRFDLKGSKLGREVLKQKEKNGLNYNNVLGKYNYALKDLDFDFFKKEIHIDYSIRDKIIEQLKIDSQLLKDLNINDYSLLLFSFSFFSNALSYSLTLL